MESRDVGWGEVHEKSKAVAKLAADDGFKPDWVVGVLRGGMVPAVIISIFLGIRQLTSLQCESYEKDVPEKRGGEGPRITQPVRVSIEGKKVIVVDDIVESGSSMDAILEYIKSAGPAEVRTAALYVKEKSGFKPDYFGERTSLWLELPWNR